MAQVRSFQIGFEVSQKTDLTAVSLYGCVTGGSYVANGHRISVRQSSMVASVRSLTCDQSL